MQILQVSIRIATLCGMCSISDGSQIRLKYGQKLVVLVLLVVLIVHVKFSINEVLYELKIGDIGTGLYATLQVVSAHSAIGCYASSVFQMESFRGVFNALQEIYDRCM